MQGYPPGYDPSMDPTLSGGVGGYQVGMDPMAGASMAPAPGMGTLGSHPSGSVPQMGLSGGDQFALGMAQTGEFATNAFAVTAMASPVLRASGHRGLAGIGRVAGVADPFRLMGPGMKMIGGAWGRTAGMTAGLGTRSAAGIAMRVGGRAAIMGGAAATGIGVPLAIGMSAMEVPLRAMSNMAGGIQDRYTGMATMANAAPAGMHYTANEARGFGGMRGTGGMNQMASSMGMDMGGMQDLIGALGSQGTFNGARDMQQFSQKLRTALQQLKDVARETDSTLAEANQMIQGLSAHGFQGGGIRSAASSLTSRGQVSGLGTDALYASGTMGSDVGRQIGVNRQMMFNQFSRGASVMAHGTRAGTIDSGLVDFFGGAQQASAMVESQALQGFMGSSLAAYAMDPRAAARGVSQVNQERLQQVMSGQVNAEMLQTVTPEMINASLQSRARHVLAPHAQQAITAFGLAGGAGDATASSRMTQMGFAASPEQALLMLQSQRAQGAEGAAAETQARMDAGAAQHRQMLAQAPGLGTRLWRSSGMAEMAHDFTEATSSWGGRISAQFSNVGSPGDTSGAVGQLGLQQARGLTARQIELAQGIREEAWAGGGTGLFKGGMARSVDMTSGGLFEGTSGLMTLGQLRDRRGWGFGDLNEANEDILEDRHNQLMASSTYRRHLHRTGSSALEDDGLTRDSREGRDFIRTENAIGQDHAIAASILRAGGQGYSRGLALGGTAENQADARRLLEGRVAMFGDTGADSKRNWTSEGRQMGILSRSGGFRNIGDDERAALTARETILRRTGVLSEDRGTFGDQRITESDYAAMSGEQQARLMEETRGALRGIGAEGVNLQDLFGDVGNVENSIIANFTEGEQILRNIGHSFENRLEDLGIGDERQQVDFNRSFVSNEQFRADVGELFRIHSWSSGEGLDARVRQELEAQGVSGAADMARTDDRYRAMQSAVKETARGEMGTLVARNRDVAGADILRLLAAGDGAGQSRIRADRWRSELAGAYGGEGLADRIDASAAYSAYHKASDVQLGRLTSRVQDFLGRTEDVIEGDPGEYTRWDQTSRDRMRTALDYSSGVGESGSEGYDSEENTASYQRYQAWFEEKGMNALDMQTFIAGSDEHEFGGVRQGDQYHYFETQEQLNDYVRAKRHSMGGYRRELGGSRFDASLRESQAVGSVGQEFRQAIGRFGALEGDSDPAERLARSQDIISSIYDYQGDQAQERQRFVEAMGPGAQDTMRTIDTLLNLSLGENDDNLNLWGDARTMLRQRGVAGDQIESTLEGIRDAGREGGGGREEQLRLIFEALGQSLDQTLVTAGEQQGDAATNMLQAATVLETAGHNLMTAAELMGGPPGESPSSSDLNLKTNIQHVGASESGIPTYTFQYRGDPTGTTYFGTMAQDLLESHPHAVTVTSDGFYAVYYGLIDVNFEEVEVNNGKAI